MRACACVRALGGKFALRNRKLAYLEGAAGSVTTLSKSGVCMPNNMSGSDTSSIYHGIERKLLVMYMHKTCERKIVRCKEINLGNAAQQGILVLFLGSRADQVIFRIFLLFGRLELIMSILQTETRCNEACTLSPVATRVRLILETSCCVKSGAQVLDAGHFMNGARSEVLFVQGKARPQPL